MTESVFWPKYSKLQRFNRDALPLVGWQAFRKKVTTEMVRIDGPFVVETREGPLMCEDGWLARDAHGWPYPIAADEHEAIYEPAEDDPEDSPA